MNRPGATATSNYVWDSFKSLAGHRPGQASTHGARQVSCRSPTRPGLHPRSVSSFLPVTGRGNLRARSLSALLADPRAVEALYQGASGLGAGLQTVEASIQGRCRPLSPVPDPSSPARGVQVPGVRSCKSRVAARFQPPTSRSPRPRAVLAVTCLTARIALRARSARAMPTNLTGLSAAQRAWRLLPSVFAMASYVRCRTPSRVANVTATYARSDAGDMTASLVTSTRARYPFRSRFARRIVRHPGSSHPSRSSSRRQYRSDRSQHPRDAAHSETDSARAFRGRCKPLRRAKSFKPPADSFRNASIGIHAYREPRRVAGVSTMIPPRRPSADARFALTFRERLDSTCFGLYVFRPWGVVLGWNWLPVANSEGARGLKPLAFGEPGANHPESHRAPLRLPP